MNEEIILNVETNSPYVIGAVAYVEQLENGAKITIVDKNGTTTATVYDGNDGKSISSITLNDDYTLTILYTDGDTTTTSSIRGATGASGVYYGEEEPTDPVVNVWVDPADGDGSVLKIRDEDDQWTPIESIVGEPAGFGTVTATVDANHGTPAVTVTTSGDDTAKNFAFAFSNLQPAPYDDSELQADFAVLQGQFDTAVAAVTTDTEVTDIRVGADGITDTTAGASVRRQFTDLKSDLSDYTNDVIGVKDYFMGAKWTEEYYINSSGAIVSNSAFHYSDDFAVTDGTYYIYTRSTVANTTIRIVGYVSGSFDSVVAELVSVSGDKTYQIVCDDIDSLRISASKYLNVLAVTTVPIVSEQIDAIRQIADSSAKQIDFSDTNNFYISNDGSALVHDSGVYISTKPFDVTAGSKIVINAKGLSTAIAMISEYRNGLYIPLIISDDSTVKEYSYTLDSNCKIVISFDKNNPHNGFVAIQPDKKLGTNTTQIIDLSQYEIGFVDSYGTVQSSGNWKHTKPFYAYEGDSIDFMGFHYNGVPIVCKIVDGAFFPMIVADSSAEKRTQYAVLSDGYYIVNFTSSYTNALEVNGLVTKRLNNVDSNAEAIPYLSMFHKIGGIGDSLMNGAINNGLQTIDTPKYSWLSNIARFLGLDYALYAQGGMTTKAWWNDTGGKKTALANESEKCSLYYIALGTNDKNQSVYPIGTSSDSAGDDTFAGYYKAIIEYVHTNAPHALIICVTTYNNSEYSAPYNQMIEAIAEQYNYCRFLDYASNSPIWTTQSNLFVADSHFTTTGYVFVANIMKDQSEIIIKDRLSEFAQLGRNYPNI